MLTPERETHPLIRDALAAAEREGTTAAKIAAFLRAMPQEVVFAQLGEFEHALVANYPGDAETFGELADLVDLAGRQGRLFGE